MSSTSSRAVRLDEVLSGLLRAAPEIEAAAVVSFDGLPMASALPGSMDEDRVAAMSAALLSLGERAAQGLGRGELSQVYIEGEHGTVFLVSADDEAVLVAVAAAGAKVGLMLYEVRHAASAVAAALRQEPEQPVAAAPESYAPESHAPESYAPESYAPESYEAATYEAPVEPLAYPDPALETPVLAAVEAAVDPGPSYTGNGDGATADLSGWQSYAPETSSGEPTTWS